MKENSETRPIRIKKPIYIQHEHPSFFRSQKQNSTKTTHLSQKCFYFFDKHRERLHVSALFIKPLERIVSNLIQIFNSSVY